MQIRETIRWAIFAGEEKDYVKLTTRVLLALIIGAAILLLTNGRLIANIGVSTDKMLFWKTGGTIQSGDYVTFMLDHPLLSRPVKVVKQVKCTPGQHLKVDMEAAYCDGVYLGPKKKKTLTGKDMPLFIYNGRIPDGMYFLMNEHKDSFDSRYYGLVEGSKLTRLKVLF